VFDFKSIIYLDKEFISDHYEQSKGVSPETKITKSENINAGMKAVFLSAGASATESRTFSYSTTKMLSELQSELNDYQDFDSSFHTIGSASKYVWVTGSMWTSSVKVTRKKSSMTIFGKPPERNPEDNEEKIVAEESYFSINDKCENKFALIANIEYFSTGIEPLLELRKTVVNELEFKVKALIRVLPAKSSFGEWLAIPLVVIEQGS
jgi:hypothetical protein